MMMSIKEFILEKLEDKTELLASLGCDVMKCVECPLSDECNDCDDFAECEELFRRNMDREFEFPERKWK